MTTKEKALYSLFCGRINVPKAAKYCGLTTDEMKAEFIAYAKLFPAEDWELDIKPCWPYS